MNKREAIRAMCDGKKVCREVWDDGGFLQMDENGQVIHEDGFADDINDYYDADDWQIYEEPKPKVTYEDAVAAKTVRIYWPDFVWQPDGFITYHREHESFGNNIKKWCVTSLRAFDLADRKGYQMEVVE